MKKNKNIISVGAILLLVLISFVFVVSKNRKYENANLQVPVLMYHHFTEDKQQTTSETVHTEEFKKQMRYLKDNGYTALTSNELIDIINGKKRAPKNPILITADDGYLSNYEYMYPVLKENKLKATVFLIGDRVDNADTQSIGLPKINWDKAKEMYQSGVMDFQSHTYNSHDMLQTKSGEKGNFSAPLLGESDDRYKSRIDKDIKQSIKSIEDNLGYTPLAIAYPFGHYSNISEEVLKENNIKLSFTVNPGYITNEDNGYLLNRINIHGDYTLDDFIQKLNNN